MPRNKISPEARDALCPSHEAVLGSALIGVVGSDGEVGLLGRPLPVDEDFLAAARRGRAPEKRFRFAAPCQKSDCRQWAGGRCGVIDRVLDALGASPGRLPPCGIRAQCRWYQQRGGSACHVCPKVVTDTRDAPRADHTSSRNGTALEITSGEPP